MRRSPHTNPEVFEKVIAQAARRLDAARRTAAAGRGDGAIDRRRGSKPDIDRAWVAIAEPGTHQRGASPESHAVQQRDPRSVRARSAGLRREVAAARRRDRRRQLRQFRRRPHHFDRASRALSVGRAAGDAAARRVCRRRSPALDDLRDSAARRPGRSAGRRSAVRIARRHRGALPVPGRRRVLDQGPAAAPVSGLPDGHGLAATARRAARRQAAEAIHRRRQGAGDARRRRAMPATASPASPARPSGKPTCS